MHYFSEKPPSLDKLEDTLEDGSSRELWTEESPPFLLLLALLRLDLREAGLLLLLLDSMGVWSSSLNLAVAVTLVTFPLPLGDELRLEPLLEP